MKNAPKSPDLSVFDRPKVCGVAAFVNAHLSDDDKVIFEAALDSKYSSHVIWLWLAERGLDLAMQQVYRHRMGRCCCRPRHVRKEAA